MSRRTYTQADIVHELRKLADKAPSRASFAREHGISGAYLSDVISMRKEPGPKILAILGYEALPPIYTYRRSAL